MTVDDEIREAARLAHFLATGEIQPRYDGAEVLPRGAHTPRGRFEAVWEASNDPTNNQPCDA